MKLFINWVYVMLYNYTTNRTFALLNINTILQESMISNSYVSIFIKLTLK